MNSGDSQAARLDRLLDAALELEGEARSRFVASEAVDAALRDELSELLDAAEKVNPLDRPPAELLAAAAELFGHGAVPRVTDSGQRIGRYRLLRLLGEGGMATVWLAERDDDSFNHKVAVKCLRTGLATSERRARFLREQRVLAQLQHPQIARLYDAGISADDVPFIVMEWVDGLSLTRYCDHHQLDIVERLRIFRKICAAVAYAHQNLIVHRDLKPGNIMVGADGEPKLLDFGIAKLLDDSDEQMTRTGVQLFTPDYAAPEQLSGLSTTTATDVYALGIILYELLCGLRPRHVSSMSMPITAPSEALRRFASTAGSERARSTQEAKEIARVRMSTPDRLCDGLRGDLDTIALKASQEQPERRYATVAALSDDVQRYLHRQPINARPDSLRYRTRMFLRRNALAVVASGAVTLALIGGIVVSLWQVGIADHERQRAEQERRHAEQRFEDVRGLAHAMIFDLHDELVKLQGSTAARAMLIKQALTYLQRLGEQDDAAIPLRLELADAWLRVGDVQGAPGMPNLGHLQGALLSYAQATQRIDSVLHEAPANSSARVLQAQVLLHRAAVLYQTDALPAADEAYRRDIRLWTLLLHDRIGGTGQGLAEAEIGLGNVLFWAGKREQALHYYETAQATMEAVGPGNSPTTYAMFLGKCEIGRGDTLNWMGRPQEADAILRHALERFLALQRQRPDDPTVINLTATAWMKLGDNLIDTPDKAGTLAAYQNARSGFAKLAVADPADMRAKRQLALCEQEIGDTLVALRRYDEAMENYWSALQTEQDVATHDPHDETTRQDMANTWYGIAGLHQERNQTAPAIAAYRQALTIRQNLLTQNPTAAALQRDVAQVLGNLAGVETDHKAACQDWIASDAQWRSLATRGEIAPADRADIAAAHQNAAACR